LISTARLCKLCHLHQEKCVKDAVQPNRKGEALGAY